VVMLEGEAVAVTLTEFRLLEALILAKARVLSRDQLMDKAIGPDIAVTAGTTAEITVTIEERAPITFVVPALRSWFGS